MPVRIALIGDYSPEIVAHRAIPRALELARGEIRGGIAWDWIPTAALGDAATTCAAFSGLWIAPGSPYENADGVLAAIRFAREHKQPLLGTCGGFQHAVIEFARNVAGLPDADHAETNPAARTAVIARLASPLVERNGRVDFVPGSRLHQCYGRASAEEGYHCNYGVNPDYRLALERAGLRFSAIDAAGEPRAAELADTVHPFFVGTLFQPERAALRDETPPLVLTFIRAACDAFASPFSSP